MAIPLLIAGGALLAGAAAGAAKKAENDGRSAPRHSGSFQETKYYDPNAQFWGGRRGGLQDYSANLNTRRQTVEDRAAFNPNYRDANSWDRMSVKARQDQQRAAQLMMDRASGKTPSIAGMQSQADILALQRGGAQQAQQAMAQQGAMQASARGAAGVALAGQTAAGNTANAQSAIGRSAAQATQNISNQAQVNAANERMQAEQAAFGAYSGMRGGDVASQAQAAQQAQFGAQMGQANRNANDARAMGYEQMDYGAQQAQLAAQLQNQGQLAQSHAAADSHNAAAYAAREANDKGWAESIFGGMKDGIGMAGTATQSDARTKQPYGNAFSSPAGAKQPIDMGDVEDWNDTNYAGEAEDFDRPTAAMLDDRYAQANPRRMSMREMLDEMKQDEERARQAEAAQEQARQAKDPAVGLDRISDYRKQIALNPGGTRPLGKPDRGDEWDMGLAPGTGDFDRTAPKAKTTEWWNQPDGARAHAFNSPVEAKKPMLDADSNEVSFPGHLPDTYKKPNHETFSDESQYAANEPERAGRWEGDRYLPPLRNGFTSDDEAKVLQARQRSFYDGMNFVRENHRQITGFAPQQYNAESMPDYMKPTPKGRRLDRTGPETASKIDRREPTSSDDHPAPDVQAPGGRGKEMSKKDFEVADQRAQREAALANANREAEAQGVAPAVSYLPPPAPRVAPTAAPSAVVGARPFERGRPIDPSYGALFQQAKPEYLRDNLYSDERTKLPALDRGSLADANRKMVGTPYTYRDEFVPPHEKPGQPHFGFMTQNLRESPVTSVAVEKDPRTGMDMVDRDRMLQVVASGVADLQRQEDETRLALKKGGRRPPEDRR